MTIGFEQGVPVSLDGTALEPLALVRELNRLGGLHGVGRSDVIEDRLFGIKSRELYETPAPTLLLTAHRDLESLVQSREMLQLKEALSPALRRAGVHGAVVPRPARVRCKASSGRRSATSPGRCACKLYKGACRVVGRRSPHSLYDGRLANQANLEWFDGQWASWPRASRRCGRCRRAWPPGGSRRSRRAPGGWAAPLQARAGGQAR